MVKWRQLTFNLQRKDKMMNNLHHVHHRSYLSSFFFDDSFENLWNNFNFQKWWQWQTQEPCCSTCKGRYVEALHIKNHRHNVGLLPYSSSSYPRPLASSCIIFEFRIPRDAQLAIAQSLKLHTASLFFNLRLSSLGSNFLSFLGVRGGYETQNGLCLE